VQQPERDRPGGRPGRAVRRRLQPDQRRCAFPVAVAGEDAEPGLGPAVTAAARAGRRPEHAPPPARSLLALDAGPDRDAARPGAARQRRRVA
jgi:hypothetical protein